MLYPPRRVAVRQSKAQRGCMSTMVVIGVHHGHLHGPPLHGRHGLQICAQGTAGEGLYLGRPLLLADGNLTLRDRHGECKAALSMTLQSSIWSEANIIEKLLPWIVETAQVLRSVI